MQQIIYCAFGVAVQLIVLLDQKNKKINHKNLNLSLVSTFVEKGMIPHTLV